MLDVPKKGVRPTQDRVRAAIFSALQAVIPGTSVLDLFAGTGAFGLEALSRGALLACFVENDRKTLPYLKKNVEQLLGGQAENCDKDDQKWWLVSGDAGQFLAGNPVKAPFDIIFADPPYDSGEKWSKIILYHLSRRSILAKKGYLIIESGAKSPRVEAEGWNIYWERLYGETRVCIYRLK